jgi:leucyl-tRNA synthetase
VSSYIGGNEHAVLHLMDARVITMVLHDLGHVQFEEPFPRFRAHGTIVRDGTKMSKSRGNVVVPDEYIAKWGADTFRMYLMFLGPYQEGGDFRDEGISGIRRFLDKVWGLVEGARPATGRGLPQDAVRKLHQTVRGVGGDLEELRYNTAISKLMEYVTLLRKGQEGQDGQAVQGGISEDLVRPLVIMLEPFATHLCEECWERLGSDTSVFEASWPVYDSELAKEDLIELVIQVNGKVRGRLQVTAGIPEEEAIEQALAQESVQRFVSGSSIRKTIYVPNRLVNIVI